MKKNRFVSLRIKMIIYVLAICLLIGILAIFSVRGIAISIVNNEYSSKADQIVEAVANTLDPAKVNELTDAVLNIYQGIDNIVPSTEWGSDKWNDYIANYSAIEDLPLFSEIKEHLSLYQGIFEVDCIYITKYKPEIVNAIYIVDADPEEPCPPGCVDAFEDGLWPDENGSAIPATISNEDVYGWLVSAAYPVFYNGQAIAHVCVDISMNDIKAKEHRYVIIASVSMVLITILLLILAYFYIDKNVIKPVKDLSITAENYCSESNDVEHHAFEILKINTNDEISQLLSSMKKMEADMNSNLNTLINTRVALRESQELAEKDSLTGIRNKTAYDHEVKKIEKDIADGFNEFGLAMVDLNFLKKTNDTYGHEKGNISIRRLCMLVCEVFEHSPVFRIGGDEFIVVLKNRDYRNVDNLIEDFNNHLTTYQNDDTLQPWEKISAAIGYYKFDKTVDKTVEDVFKKADKAMYDRKTAMKAQRTD
ncbi:MAG: GGDEF domain-containing protein [Lachnospiraceae bacterium]|nr:GGDEF domain-containing protein [Lachnospiraceae bacterium]